MHITHVVRGCEYSTSTRKYNMLYDVRLGKADLCAPAVNIMAKKRRLRLKAFEAPRFRQAFRASSGLLVI